jgi:hypothetical protein
VTLPYLEIFLALFAVYLGFSVWMRLDARYPIAAALLLLVAAAVADAGGAVALANTLAEYVFVLLAGGVILLLIEHVRSPTPSSGPETTGGDGGRETPPEPADEGDSPADQGLDGLEE